MSKSENRARRVRERPLQPYCCLTLVELSAQEINPHMSDLWQALAASVSFRLPEHCEFFLEYARYSIRHFDSNSAVCLQITIPRTGSDLG